MVWQDIYHVEQGNDGAQNGVTELALDDRETRADVSHTCERKRPRRSASRHQQWRITLRGVAEDGAALQRREGGAVSMVAESLRRKANTDQQNRYKRPALRRSDRDETTPKDQEKDKVTDMLLWIGCANFRNFIEDSVPHRKNGHVERRGNCHLQDHFLHVTKKGQKKTHASIDKEL